MGKTRLILTNTENQRKYKVEFEAVKESLIEQISSSYEVNRCKQWEFQVVICSC